MNIDNERLNVLKSLQEDVYKITAVGQAGTKTSVEYEKDSIQGARNAAIDGLDIPEKNITKIEKLDKEEPKTEERNTKDESLEENSIEGGLADDMSIEHIANKHNSTVAQLNQELKLGIEVELEHTKDEEKAKEIAMDHLVEIPDYYTRLNNMEKEAEEDLNETSVKNVDNSNMNIRQAMDYINPDGSVTDEGRQAEKEGKIKIEESSISGIVPTPTINTPSEPIKKEWPEDSDAAYFAQAPGPSLMRISASSL